MSDRPAISALPTLERATLLAMALWQGNLSQSNWLDLVRRTGVKNSLGKALTLADIKAAVQTLLQQGWLYQPPGEGYQLDLRYDQARLFQAYEYLLRYENVKVWVECIRDVVSSKYFRPYLTRQPREYYRREMWLAILTGAPALLMELEAQYIDSTPDQGHYPLNVLADPADATTLMPLLHPAISQRMLLQSLMSATYGLSDCDHLADYALAQLQVNPEDPYLTELTGWFALVRGELTLLDELISAAPQLTLGFPASLLLLAGDYAAARPAFLQLKALQKKHSAGRAKQLTHFPGWFHLLSLFSSDAVGQQTAIKQQLNALKGDSHGTGCQLFGLLLQQLVSPGSVSSDDVMARFPLRPAMVNLEGLFSLFALYWLHALPQQPAEQMLGKERSWLFDAGYHWVAAELDVLLAQAFGTPQLWPDWHQDHNLRPLCLMLQPKERWQTALAALEQLTATEPNTQQHSDSRLVWLLRKSSYSLAIEPREQKRNAKGQWSAGRPVALKRLRHEPESVASLSPLDLPVLECIEAWEQGYYGSYSYELNPNRAMYALINHPLVFWEDAPQSPVEIKAAQFYLQLATEGSGFRLSLQPAALLETQQFWCEETPTSILVYQSSAMVRNLADILQGGLQVPANGKSQLLASIEKLAPQLPVHSDVPVLAAKIPTVDANPVIYCHLLPWQQGLRLQLLVRPLSQGSWFKPGKGSAQLVGELDGQAVQTRRELAAELRQQELLQQLCPALQDAEFDGHQWLFGSAQLCLELLEQLQQVPPEQFCLQWPEGERFRLRKQATFRDLSLNIRQQSQWLQLDGQLQLDQDKVLSLKELLTLVTSSHGRFIALGGADYLALTDSLRKQLDELAQLPARQAADGLQLNPLSAPLLTDLLEGAGAVQSNKAWQQHVARMNAAFDLKPALPSTLQAELRDYQTQGFQWLARLAHWGVGACLADDMGLGKTVQTLALLLLRAAGGPALVVAPLSVANNWRSEATRFAPTLQLHWYHDSRELSALGPFDVVICSYGLLQTDQDKFSACHWHTVVLDEAQAIKNAQTKRAKAAMALQADFRMIATGTPLENHLGELWSLFQFINPGLLGTKEQFQQKFAGPVEQGDMTARQLLKKLIQPYVLRRSKTQVLSELPARTEIELAVELSDEERHLYEALRQQSLEKLADVKEGQAVQVLAEIMRLRRFCCHPQLVLPEQQITGSKLAVFAETLQELLDNNHKVLVFSQFVDHLAIVRRYLDTQHCAYQYLDGSTTVAERKKRVDAFQNGEGDVFLISLKAGGSGLNLTAADYVIHLDPWWNPAVEDQASDRAHRIGQTRPVTIYRLVTQNTIEQKILALHGQKRELADSLLEGGDLAARLDTRQLLALIHAAS